MTQFTALDTLTATIAKRAAEGDSSRSHTAQLLAKGPARVAKKLGEEAVETAIAAAQGHREETITESADLLFHLLVLWHSMGIEASEVMAELTRREGTSGIEEKAGRSAD